MNKPLPSKLAVKPETNVFANAPAGLMHVFVHDYNLPASIGIHPHEKKDKQNIIVSVDLSIEDNTVCLLYTSPSPRDATLSRMPSSA